MPSTSFFHNVTLLTFAGLNAALIWFRRQAVPTRDVAISLIALFLVAANLVLFPAKQEVVLKKTPRFKKLFPILSIFEFTFFLVIPWMLLIQNDILAFTLSSHLYIIQTQIALESLLFAQTRGRAGTFFWFIAISNMYRGVGISTWIYRYMQVRDEMPSATVTRFMAVYSALALLVWLAADAFIIFLWYPCLKSSIGQHDTAASLRTFEDAVVIVTGCASGIGRALAEELAEKGASAIVLIDRQKALAEEVAVTLRNRGVTAKVYNVDVRSFPDMQRVVSETKKTFGRLDYMFNNAGIIVMGPIEKIGVENFDYIFDVNVRGVHNGVQAAYPIMKEQGFGHIVNTSSLLGLIPFGEWGVAYSASKHAVVGLSTNLRIEAAKYGVRVSVFCPGSIDTPIHKGGEYGKNLTGIPKDIWDAQLAKAHFMDARLCVKQALKDVAKNKPIIIVPELPLMKSRLLYRLSPSLWLHRAVNKSSLKKKLEK